MRRFGTAGTLHISCDLHLEDLQPSAAWLLRHEQQVQNPLALQRRVIEKQRRVGTGGERTNALEWKAAGSAVQHQLELVVVQWCSSASSLLLVDGVVRGAGGAVGHDASAASASSGGAREAAEQHAAAQHRLVVCNPQRQMVQVSRLNTR